MTIEGGCICGAVRYRIEEADPPFVACFCSDCQTRSGSAMGLTMPVWANKFVIAGEVIEGRRVLPTGAAAVVYSCAACHTELYSHNTRMEGLVTVRVGTLDDSGERQPAAYIWTQSKPDWVTLPDDARVFETQPEDPAVWMEIFELGRRPQ